MIELNLLGLTENAPELEIGSRKWALELAAQDGQTTSEVFCQALARAKPDLPELINGLQSQRFFVLSDNIYSKGAIDGQFLVEGQDMFGQQVLVSLYTTAIQPVRLGSELSARQIGFMMRHVGFAERDRKFIDALGKDPLVAELLERTKRRFRRDQIAVYDSLPDCYLRDSPLIVPNPRPYLAEFKNELI